MSTINTWITTTPEQAIASIRYGHSRCLPVDIPEGYQQKMQQFTFDWNQLKAVIGNEAAHFAVRTEPTEIRVFTRSCVFTINLAVPYAQVSLDETVWMTELVTLHQRREQAETALAHERRQHYDTRCELRSKEQTLLKRESELRQLQGEHRNALKKLKQEELRTASLLSRCMKLVRKFGKKAIKPQPAAV
jgi:hypothetical protein